MSTAVPTYYFAPIRKKEVPRLKQHSYAGEIAEITLCIQLKAYQRKFFFCNRERTQLFSHFLERK